jgi:hypothetical protein
MVVSLTFMLYAVKWPHQNSLGNPHRTANYWESRLFNEFL